MFGLAPTGSSPTLWETLLDYRHDRHSWTNRSGAPALAIERKMSEENSTSGRRTLTGKVVSDKMDKTVSVEVIRRVKHSRYKKYINRRNIYKAHDEANECEVGDTVVVRESRPLSKTKRWVVVERRPRSN